MGLKISKISFIAITVFACFLNSNEEREKLPTYSQRKVQAENKNLFKSTPDMPIAQNNSNLQQNNEPPRVNTPQEVLSPNTSPSKPKNEDDAQKSPATRSEFTIFICTANLFMHNGYKKLFNNEDELSDKILDLLKSKAGPKENDIIIYGFQELFSSNTYFHERLEQMGGTIAKSIDSQGFSNTIAVFSNLENIKTNKKGAINFKNKYRSGRSACFIDFPDINLSIANTHLFGGKYDSIEWYKYKNARESMLAEIISAENPIGKKPNIVLGDFNCDTENDNKETKAYWKNILKTTTKDKTVTYEDIKRFLISAHVFLNSSGYTSLLDRSRINTSTPFNTVCDWIYFDKQKIKSYKILEQGIYDAMEAGLADHNWLWVRIKIYI